MGEHAEAIDVCFVLDIVAEELAVDWLLMRLVFKDSIVCAVGHHLDLVF